MCLAPSIPAAPQLPPEQQAQQLPDSGSVTSNVARRVTDKQRAGANTILTSGSGVSAAAPTGQKTLLGQ